MTRILVLIKGLARGGAEQLLVSAAPYLDRSRFEYMFVYVDPELDALAPTLGDLGYPVQSLGGTDPRWPWRLRKLIKEQAIDLVHSHLPIVGVGARFATLRTGIKLVYTEHNVWDSYRRLTRFANMVTIRFDDHVFAVSDHVRESMKPPFAHLESVGLETLIHGLDPNRIALAGSGDDLMASLGVPAGSPVIGNVANFRTEKDHRTLLRAARVVLDERPDARFVLVGGGPLEREVKAEARQLGIDHRIVFTGFRNDAPELLQHFDVFVLSSIHEGLSIALLEAMAAGIPSVVTAAGGVPEVITHGREGYMVEPRDAAGLADRILAVLANPEVAARMRKAAQLRAGEFDIRKAVSRMESVYEQLVPTGRVAVT